MVIELAPWPRFGTSAIEIPTKVMNAGECFRRLVPKEHNIPVGDIWTCAFKTGRESL